MISQEPRLLYQGVNYLGFLAQQLGDLAGKTTLAHELIQNADDAKDESGSLSATRISFDVRDDTLIVSNDATFRKIDFDRISDVASGSKRRESGDRTTGSFGVGFISVYQVTDNPEIHSAGRIWILRPDRPDNERIAEWDDPSTTRDSGTVFRLPWAFRDSTVRQELKARTVDAAYVESFVDELRESLPRAILFLKKLERIELLRNGESVSVVTRKTDGDTVWIDHDGHVNCWRILKEHFSQEAQYLKDRFRGSIDEDRSSLVRVAIPETLMVEGLLFATLPTEQSTGLPFHVDADFYPESDRKAIAFGDEHDPRSEWNRAAIRTAASAIETKLLDLRDMCDDDAPAFWDFLSKLQQLHQVREDDARLPLGVFWESLLPSLKEAPIVLTESGKWLVPKLTRIPTGPEEEAAVAAFEELGIELVNRELWREHRNLLTRGDVGVRRISGQDLYQRLSAKGCEALSVSSLPVKPESLPLLWRGIEAILLSERGRTRAASEGLLRMCALAPGLDGHLWRCKSAYRTSKMTRELFAPWIADGVTFLAEEGVPLLDRLCSEFTVADGIVVLRFTGVGQLEGSWENGTYNPVSMLSWFEGQSSELTAEQRDDLAELQVFPSVGSLHSLNELWLAGGFEDPLGEAEILDSGLPTRLTTFIQNLGIRQLTFEDYAKRYVSRAFRKGSTIDPATKRKLLATLERHVGEVRDNTEVRRILSAAWVVDCLDGVFRQPGTVYFPSEEVKAVLGDHASYASLPSGSELRKDLYGWLGVRSRPRIADIVRVIGQKTMAKPGREARSVVTGMLRALGQRWGEISGSETSSCLSLKTKAWLPAEADANTWYTPEEVFASYNKELFVSQAKFLDLPLRDQQNIGAFLRWLGVGLSPRPIQVVRHLLRCADLEIEPPLNIYRWLNENAQPGELRDMKVKACLRVSNRYLRPDQVFWGSHPFGRFRIQLGPSLRSFQNLLEALNVRETADFTDAIEVLKDIADQTRGGAVEEEDRDVVIRCWIMLSDALATDELNEQFLRNQLEDIQCVPTNQGYLHPPSWMFFEDRPGLVERFREELDQNCIRRTERAWLAMEAAGVRLISDVVKGHVSKCVNSREDDEMAKQVMARAALIRTILEGVTDESGDRVSLLDNLRFIKGDQLLVTWRLDAFGQVWQGDSPEAVSAHWESEQRIVYFASPEIGAPPWSAIARELTLALAPGENHASISPGLKSILEASTTSDAWAQLAELGIAPVDTVSEGPVEGPVADTLGVEASETDNYHWPCDVNGDYPEMGPVTGTTDEPDGGFARHFHKSQTPDPPAAPDNPVQFPPGGPRTPLSASEHTRDAGHVGRTEPHVLRTVRRTDPGPRGMALEDAFRGMVEGDYGKRCQICSRTFATASGSWQVNVVHVVPPRKDPHANHFGDLLGLCGWHFNLLQHGQWALIDPETESPFGDLDGLRGWERMRSFILNRPPEVDENGYEFVGLPVRFSNVYQNWRAEPISLEEEIRYSKPHWQYLCSLLEV